MACSIWKRCRRRAKNCGSGIGNQAGLHGAPQRSVIVARCSPHLSADKIKTPTLVITNQQDFRVPVDQGLQLFTALRRNGVQSEALVFEDEGHFVLEQLTANAGMSPCSAGSRGISGNENRNPAPRRNGYLHCGGREKQRLRNRRSVSVLYNWEENLGVTSLM
jgi:Prolyl oligopeptidase family